MSDKFEQWFESEFPDADLSQRETLKGYNNLKYGWNAALSSLQGDAVELNPSDIEVDEYGGRYGHIHIPSNYIRVTHKSGISVSCEKHRSKHANKAEAMRGLKLILSNEYSAAKIAEQAAKIAEQEAEILRLRSENETLYTTMMAAAVEIHEHWDAHCDSEGYGPSNLMHRLERGIASRYGYDAETVVVMEAKIAELESELAEQARLLGISAERELALQAKLAEVEKDAIMWRSVSFHIEEAIRNGMCNFEIEDAYESAIQESKKGDVLIARPNMEDL